MRKLIGKLKEKFSRSDDFDLPGESDEGYVEIPPEGVAQPERSKVTVRSFVLEEFGDVKPVLDCLREGYTISLVNIRPLKDKDLVELKRAINKLKKTCDAVEGDIAGFGDDWIAVTPSFAQIHRERPQSFERVSAPGDDL
ncbi:TPA: cell division protein SepF [Candidatus Woesearchaeota archaeon]|nr:cell division protein SepF [Candidatus Woesearchaeota archaeon]